MKNNFYIIFFVLLLAISVCSAEEPKTEEPKLEVKPSVTAFFLIPQWRLSDTSNNQDVVFDVTRIYAGFNWTYDTIYGKFTTDIRRSTEARNTNGDLLRLVKFGYGGWKYYQEHAVEFGLLSLPEAQPNEKMFRRYLTSSTLDRQGFANTADLGVQLTGKCWDNILQYVVSVFNGEGYHAPETGRGKDALIRLNVMPSGKEKEGFLFSGLAHVGRSADRRTRRDRFDLQAYYSWPSLTLGAFGAVAFNTNTSAHTKLFSALADWEFIKKWHALGRWDHVRPSDGVFNDNDIGIAGVEYQLNKYLSFAVDWQKQWFENRTLSKNINHLFLHSLLQF